MTVDLKRRRFLGASAGLAAAGAWRPGLAQAPKLPMRDIIVVLPGITGSVLQKDGKDVWALSGSALLSGLRNIDKHLDLLKLRDDRPDVDDIGDGIKATRMFPDTHLLPGFWKIDGYTELLRGLSRNFQLKPGQNFFEFPYDWRRDNRVHARRLARESHGWLKAWRRGSGGKDARLVLIAHSMGGLVCRHFLECMDGWRDTRRLITFGTPYRGSVKAVNMLANGLNPLPFVDLSGLLRTFTSVYQLLPIYACYDGGDGKLERIAESAGVPNIDQARAAGALAFHREIEAAVDRNRKLSGYVENGYKIHPVVGAYQATAQVARRRGAVVEIQNAYPGRSWEGDGTVPEVSAIPIELSDQDREVYVAQMHGSLQNSSVVLEHLMKLLGKTGGTAGVRGDEVKLGLRLQDVYPAKEPVRIHVRCEQEGTMVSAVLRTLDRKVLVARKTFQSGAGESEVAFPGLAEGAYRVTVSGATAVPVADVFLVAAGG